MTTTADVRNAIKAALEAVPGIGLVHGFERYSKAASETQAFYVQHGVLLGWFIRRTARFERGPYPGRYRVETRWTIRGYHALADGQGSELAFDDLIDTIIDAFRGNDTLGGVVDTCTDDEQSGMQLEESGPVLFAGVLCHAARLGLKTYHLL